MNQVAIVFGLIITTVVGIGAYTALAPLVTQSEKPQYGGRDYERSQRGIGISLG